jgi:glycosyltransferase involved in cell wall biosynthesis
MIETAKQGGLATDDGEMAGESSSESSSGADAGPVAASNVSTGTRLAGKRCGMVVFSHYPADPRPRRAAQALLGEGMRVDLICEQDAKSPKREMVDGLEIIRIPIRHSRGGFLSYAYQYATFILMSAAIFAWRSLRRRYDLVYVHNMPDILVIGALIPKLFGAKVILDQHDPMPELMLTIFNKDKESFGVRVIRWLEKWSIARADLVITVSVTFKRIFSGRSCPAEKVGVVMNTPDESLFPCRRARSYPVRHAGDPFVIMYHGLLESRNGLHVAVDALARFRKKFPNAELRIYGRSTPYLEQVLATVRDLGLDGSVHYLGPRKLEELAREIEQCDVGVVPNPRNDFTQINTPTRILEYLALGKPVIAPRTEGITDYFAADSLFFFDSGDTKDFEEKLEYVASHPGEAVATAERGQQVYLRHTWEQEREALVSLVTQLIHQGKAA